MLWKRENEGQTGYKTDYRLAGKAMTSMADIILITS